MALRNPQPTSPQNFAREQLEAMQEKTFGFKALREQLAEQYAEQGTPLSGLTILEQIEDRICNANGVASELNVRIGSLADRALGSVPELDCGGSVEEPDSAAIRRVFLAIEALERTIEALGQNVQRIEGIA